MSKDTGGSAFPHEPYRSLIGEFNEGSCGMTLRDYIATKVVGSLAAKQSNYGWTDEEIAKDSYAIADAMLAERSK